MIEEFKNWLKENEYKLRKSGLILIDKYENKSEKIVESVVIQYENELYISEIVIRNNNYIDIEILSKKTGELEFYIYCMTSKRNHLNTLLSVYLDYMISIK